MYQAVFTSHCVGKLILRREEKIYAEFKAKIDEPMSRDWGIDKFKYLFLANTGIQWDAWVKGDGFINFRKLIPLKIVRYLL